MEKNYDFAHCSLVEEKCQDLSRKVSELIVADAEENITECVDVDTKVKPQLDCLI